MTYKPFEALPLYQVIEDLSVWLIPHIGNWPAQLRPTLGNQVMNSLMEVFRELTLAYASLKAEKLPHLRMASAQLDGLRMLLKTAVSLHLTSFDQFAYVSSLTGNVGKQLGGWLGQAG